ncbi:MAG: class II aldolase/adducin family protein, partial [Rhodothermales bacterium]|nr:class II aldolase/adducin family protein [Rhodothermales bacterium]
MTHEGFIQYRLDHRIGELDRNRFVDQVCKLASWRQILSRTGLVGQDPGRYQGAGFGNVSCRVGPPSSGRGSRAFLITGTQTGIKRVIGLIDFALVERYDYQENHLTSCGLVKPSSEALTHAALYDMGPQIRCVFHAHSPSIWQRRKELRLATTDQDVGYGTPEMANEVQRLYAGT